jgi:hypothetical protein
LTGDRIVQPRPRHRGHRRRVGAARRRPP